MIMTSCVQRRVLSCLRAWDQMSVYHYNVVDKYRLTFIGKTTEEMEKQKAFVRYSVHACTIDKSGYFTLTVVLSLL